MVDQLSRQGLAGFLYRRIPAILRSRLPDPLIENLKEAYSQQWIMAQLYLKESQRVLIKLESAGIESLLLKGMPVAERFYGESGQRRLRDIDILLRLPNSARHTDPVLATLGYTRRSKNVLVPAINFLFCHSYEYYNHQEHIHLDLHWTIRRHRSFNIFNEQLWNRRIKFTSSSTTLPTLGDVDLLLTYLLGLFFDIGRGSLHFINFVDVHMLLLTLETQVDWEEFFNQRKTERTYLIALNMLDLVLAINGTESRFESLSRAIAGRQRDLFQPTLPEKMNLLNFRPMSFRAHHWKFKHYGIPTVLALFWWILSVPIKSINHQDFSAGLKSRIAHRK
jgi:hypothetical protein